MADGSPRAIADNLIEATLELQALMRRYAQPTTTCAQRTVRHAEEELRHIQGALDLAKALAQALGNCSDVPSRIGSLMRSMEAALAIVEVAVADMAADVASLRR